MTISKHVAQLPSFERSEQTLLRREGVVPWRAEALSVLVGSSTEAARRGTEAARRGAYKEEEEEEEEEDGEEAR